MSCQVQPSLASSPVILAKVSPQLGAEVADMYRSLPAFIDGGSAGDEQDGEPIQIDAHAA